MTTDILVVGDMAWDMVVRVAMWPAPDLDVKTAIQEGPGGQGLNIAAWARAAGARTALVTQVDRGATGRRLRQAARRYGVELWAPTLATPPTRVISLVDPAGQRALLTEAGPGPLATPRRTWSCRLLVLSGYLLARPGGEDRVEAWIAWATRASTPVAVDLAHPHIAGAWRGWLADVTWVFGNRAEWEAVGSGHVPATYAVVKNGSQGAHLQRPGRPVVHVAPPENPAPVVDSTGAGDCLMGTLLARWLTHADAARALTEAVPVASGSCRHLGALPPNPF
jgi:ribokinase